MFVQQMIARSRGAARRVVDATRRAVDSSDRAPVTSSQQADPPAKILASPLFDAAWYAETAGCSTVPIEAARHYLRHGARRGLWPHPLFVPHHVAVRAPEAVGDADPLLAYLEKGLFKLSPHPLFDLKGYVRAHPALVAATFPVRATEIRHALAAPRQPFPGDGILWVAGSASAR